MCQVAWFLVDVCQDQSVALLVSLFQKQRSRRDGEHKATPNAELAETESIYFEVYTATCRQRNNNADKYKQSLLKFLTVNKN